jgi:hypothetical protein
MTAWDAIEERLFPTTPPTETASDLRKDLERVTGIEPALSAWEADERVERDQG